MVSHGTSIMSAQPKVMIATGIEGEIENNFSAVW